MSEQFKQMMDEAVAKTRPPEKAEDRGQRIEGKKATIRIQLPALLRPAWELPPPPTPSRAVLVIEMCASVQGLFSTFHNSVLAGSVQLTASERVKLQIELEQLSRSALHVAKQLERRANAS
jgi:hypothetical protein